MAWCYVKEN